MLTTTVSTQTIFAREQTTGHWSCMSPEFKTAIRRNRKMMNKSIRHLGRNERLMFGGAVIESFRDDVYVQPLICPSKVVAEMTRINVHNSLYTQKLASRKEKQQSKQAQAQRFQLEVIMLPEGVDRFISDVVNNCGAVESLLAGCLVGGQSPLFPPEPNAGNVEYKWKLLDVTSDKLTHLTTQLRFRLTEGAGYCYYILGVKDKGGRDGCSRRDMQETLKTLYACCANIEGVRMRVLSVMCGLNTDGTLKSADNINSNVNDSNSNVADHTCDTLVAVVHCYHNTSQVTNVALTHTSTHVPPTYRDCELGAAYIYDTVLTNTWTSCFRADCSCRSGIDAEVSQCLTSPSPSPPKGMHKSFSRPSLFGYLNDSAGNGLSSADHHHASRCLSLCLDIEQRIHTHSEDSPNTTNSPNTSFEGEDEVLAMMQSISFTADTDQADADDEDDDFFMGLLSN